MRVMLCSIRGALGWPDLAFTEENLDRLFRFYLDAYARVLHRYGVKHREAVAMGELTERFFDGFECKTREMHWNYSVRREQFDAFDPQLRHTYAFVRKWRFALWSLDRQLRRLEPLRALFRERMEALAAGAEGEAG